MRFISLFNPAFRIFVMPHLDTSENWNKEHMPMKELKLFIQDMEKEAELLKAFARLEDEMQLLVAVKKWEEMEAVILNLRQKTLELDKLEQARCASFQTVKQKLGTAEDTAFLQILPLVTPELSAELLTAYRKLKVAVVQVKGATTRLTYFFKAIEESFKKVLGELFPHRKGKIYAKDGRPKKAALDSLLLNKHL
jgi:hypothetical protein